MPYKNLKALQDGVPLPAKELPLSARPSTAKIAGDVKFKNIKADCSSDGHSLFQESFFFCDLKNIGDIHGTGCIYVETVVDSDTGCAFAKVFPAKNAMNAVDILSSRVFPFFRELGVAVKEVHTQRTPEYCGLAPVHPFETFLAISHVEHLPTNVPGTPYNYLCVQFYQYLQKQFFQPVLRKKFMFTLEELQADLDAFIEVFNAMQRKRLRKNISPAFLP